MDEAGSSAGGFRFLYVHRTTLLVRVCHLGQSIPVEMGVIFLFGIGRTLPLEVVREEAFREKLQSQRD